MEKRTFTVYARADAQGRIAAVNSDAFLTDTTGWTAVDSGTGDRYHHAQGNYMPGPLRDDRGICRYRLADGKPVERTAEEMDADWAARPSTEATDTELLLLAAADHEYRLCLMELGVSEDDL